MKIEKEARNSHACQSGGLSRGLTLLGGVSSLILAGAAFFQSNEPQSLLADDQGVVAGNNAKASSSDDKLWNVSLENSSSIEILDNSLVDDSKPTRVLNVEARLGEDNYAFDEASFDRNRTEWLLAILTEDYSSLRHALENGASLNEKRYRLVEVIDSFRALPETIQPSERARLRLETDIVRQVMLDTAVEDLKSFDLWLDINNVTGRDIGEVGGDLNKLYQKYDLLLQDSTLNQIRRREIGQRQLKIESLLENPK